MTWEHSSAPAHPPGRLAISTCSTLDLIFLRTPYKPASSWSSSLITIVGSKCFPFLSSRADLEIKGFGLRWSAHEHGLTERPSASSTARPSPLSFSRILLAENRSCSYFRSVRRSNQYDLLFHCTGSFLPPRARPINSSHIASARSTWNPSIFTLDNNTPNGLMSTPVTFMSLEQPAASKAPEPQKGSRRCSASPAYRSINFSAR